MELDFDEALESEPVRAREYGVVMQRSGGVLGRRDVDGGWRVKGAEGW